MTKLIVFLNRHKSFTAIIGSLYFIATVVFHRQIANFSLHIEKKLSFKTYNQLLGLITISIFVIFSVLIINRIRKDEDSAFNSAFLIITILLLIGAHFSVLAVNVEYIHLLHYIILTFFVFSLTFRFGETIFWVTLLGAVDEVYQYYVVWPGQTYMDFNDIIYDMLGSVIAVIFIYFTLNTKAFIQTKNILLKKRIISPALVVSFILISAYFILSVSGLLQYAPQLEKPSAPILLNRITPPQNFWTVFEKGKTYHIFKPFEFVLAVGLLTLVYSGIDQRIQKTIKQSSDKK